MKSAYLLALCFLPGIGLASEVLVCAGQSAGPGAIGSLSTGAAKPAQSRPQTQTALVLFAHFRGEMPAESSVPAWSAQIFDPDLPGSFSHFYDTMSFGALRVHGAVAPRRYVSEHSAPSYLSDERTKLGQYGTFVRDILQQADGDVDFSVYDNDGPDGVPNSGDDDGVADVVFVVINSAPTGFLRGSATGIGNLGLSSEFTTDDVGKSGSPIRIETGRGTVQQGRSYAGVVGTMSHEYGHILGLPDLFDTQFLRSEEPPPPELDSGGIGRWGLNGVGRSGLERRRRAESLECVEPGADGLGSDAGRDGGRAGAETAARSRRRHRVAYRPGAARVVPPGLPQSDRIALRPQPSWRRTAGLACVRRRGGAVCRRPGVR